MSRRRTALATALATTVALAISSSAVGQVTPASDAPRTAAGTSALPPAPPAPLGAQLWGAPPPAPYGGWPSPGCANPYADAPAESPDFNRWERRPLAVEAVLSIGSPVGVLGAAIDYAPTPTFVLNAGIGVGSGGPQVAITPRLRIPLGNVVGLGIEAGLSGGPYQELCIMCEGEGHDGVPMALWANAGGVFDVRTGKGFHFRLFGGRSQILNAGACRNSATGEACSLQNDVIPYFGIALGGALLK